MCVCEGGTRLRGGGRKGRGGGQVRGSRLSLAPPFRPPSAAGQRQVTSPSPGAGRPQRREGNPSLAPPPPRNFSLSPVSSSCPGSPLLPLFPPSAQVGVSNFSSVPGYLLLKTRGVEPGFWGVFCRVEGGGGAWSRKRLISL